MLCAIRKSDSAKVIACQEEKSQAPFACPACGDDVILKKGTKVIHHFAHKPPVTCLYGSGESEAHRRAKTEIFEAIKKSPQARDIELERILGTVRPDVSGFINNARVAIEVQISSLSLETIQYRTTEYAHKGICLLWISPWHEGLAEERYAPRLWEKWIHGLYFGHIYYWQSGVTEYKFDGYMIEVEARHWYDETGDEQSGGGYFRYSKRYRTPVQIRSLDLLTDFAPRRRRAWQTLPEALLFAPICERRG